MIGRDLRASAFAPVVMAVLLAACATPADPPATDAQASAVTQRPTSASPSAEPSEATTASATAGAVVLQVGWAVPFTVTAPPDWTTDVSADIGSSNGDTQWLATGSRLMAFTRTGPETVNDWIAAVTTADQLEASEPEAVEIGGMPGFRVDLEVSEAASAERCFNDGRCYTLFQDEAGYWPVEEGRPTAAWFLDVNGETVAIVTDSREDTFDEWTATVEEILATLEWGE